MVSNIQWILNTDILLNILICQPTVMYFFDICKHLLSPLAAVLKTQLSVTLIFL